MLPPRCSYPSHAVTLTVRRSPHQQAQLVSRSSLSTPTGLRINSSPLSWVIAAKEFPNTRPKEGQRYSLGCKADQQYNKVPWCLLGRAWPAASFLRSGLRALISNTIPSVGEEWAEFGDMLLLTLLKQCISSGSQRNKKFEFSPQERQGLRQHPTPSEAICPHMTTL